MPIQTAGYALNSLAYPRDYQFLEKEICIAHLPTLELLVHRETPDNKQSLTLSLNSSILDKGWLYILGFYKL